MELEDTTAPRIFPQIDGLEFIELIGKGGVACVYKAQQLSLQRVVAVKVLHRLGAEAEVKRFQNEARLTSSIDHPNIVKIHSFGISSKIEPYLIMEYVEGKTLAEVLSTEGRLSLQQFRNIFLPLLSALEEAHGKGLVHRDIKPSNILLCKDDAGKDSVKLLDFGIAKMLGGEESSVQNLTKAGALLGSPTYMSPEQCSSVAVDARSDIYSLTCVMYESLCGEPPFKSDSALDIMNQHICEAPPTVAELSKKIELRPRFAELLLSGLAKDPAMRPQSAAWFAGNLSEALDSITLDKVPLLKKSAPTKSPVRWQGVLLGLVIWIVLATLLGRQWTGTKVKAIDPSDNRHHASQLIEGARVHKKKNDYTTAIKELEEAIALLKDDAHGKTMLAEAYFEAANVAAAFTLAHEPQASIMEKKVSEYGDASIALAHELNNKERCYCAAFQRITFLHRAEDAGVAVKLFRKADELFGFASEKSFDLKFHAINILLRIKQYDLADGLSKEALALAIKVNDNPSVETFNILRGEAYRVSVLARKGRTQECQRLARKIASEVTSGNGAFLDSDMRKQVFDQLLGSLTYLKDMSLAQAITDDELRSNQALYEVKNRPWISGHYYLMLAEGYKSAGQLKGEYDSFEKAASYLSRSGISDNDEKYCLENLLTICRAAKLDGKNFASRLATLEKHQ